MKIALQLIIFIMLTGCSNKGVYDGIQTSNQLECSKVPSSHYDECMQNVSQTYDEYEREREKI